MFVLVSMTMSRLNVCKRFYLTADCGKIRPWRSLLSFSLSSSLVYFHSGHIQSEIISKKLEGRCSFLLSILFLFSFLLRNLVLFFIYASLISAKERVFFIFLNVFISYISFIYFFFIFYFFLNVGKTVSVGPDVCLHTKNKKDLQLSDRNYSCSCKATN